MSFHGAGGKQKQPPRPTRTGWLARTLPPRVTAPKGIDRKIALYMAADLACNFLALVYRARLKAHYLAGFDPYNGDRKNVPRKYIQRFYG